MDDQWLNEIAPTINALSRFLTMENNGVRVYEIKNHFSPDGRQVYEMSNGLCYAKDSEGTWAVV